MLSSRVLPLGTNPLAHFHGTVETLSLQRPCQHASCPVSMCVRLPQVFSMPLVGVWVRGVGTVEHPAVLAACLRFAFSTTLLDKATQPPDAFLLLLFPPGAPGCEQLSHAAQLLLRTKCTSYACGGWGGVCMCAHFVLCSTLDRVGWMHGTRAVAVYFSNLHPERNG